MFLIFLTVWKNNNRKPERDNMYWWRRITCPEIFQGKDKKNHYFEGWYYKIVDASSDHMIVIIPGISMNGLDSHAFIQIMMDDHKSYYLRFPISDFYYNEKKFELWIGKNYFSSKRVIINIRDDDPEIFGSLGFEDAYILPHSLVRPSIMGPFAYIPGMECYHGVIHIKSKVTGSLRIPDGRLNYEGGLGYLEKDWGTSFPKGYIWMQSNHFIKDASFMLSIGRIPCFGASFRGFLSFLRINQTCLVFATYTGAKIKDMEYGREKLKIRLEDLRFRLEITAQYHQGGTILAPFRGEMHRQIVENMDGVIEIKLWKRDGKLLYQDRGRRSGLEIVDPDQL